MNTGFKRRFVFFKTFRYRRATKLIDPLVKNCYQHLWKVLNKKILNKKTYALDVRLIKRQSPNENVWLPYVSKSTSTPSK